MSLDFGHFFSLQVSLFSIPLNCYRILAILLFLLHYFLWKLPDIEVLFSIAVFSLLIYIEKRPDLAAAVAPRDRPAALIVVFRSIRYLRRIRRKLIPRGLPAWLLDLKTVVSYINFLSLAPTLICIAFTPDHFFKRVNGSGGAFNSIYKSPIQFITATTALWVAVVSQISYALKITINTITLKWMIIVGVLITPVIMILLTIGFRLLYWLSGINKRYKELCESFCGIQKGAYWQIFLPSTYVSLAPGRYLWRILYFYSYIYFAIFFALIYSIPFFILDAAFGGGWGILTFVIIGSRTIIYPYLVLLREAMNSPKRAEGSHIASDQSEYLQDLHLPQVQIPLPAHEK